MKHGAALLGVLTALGMTTGAHAQPRQLGPEPVEVWEGSMNYAATAASLLDCVPGSCADGGAGIQGQTCAGLAGSSVRLDTVPDLPGLRVVHARLSWMATTAAGAGPDQMVTLTPPDGQPIAAGMDMALGQAFYDDGLPDQECQLIGALGCPGAACDIGFYMAHADVTAALQAHLDGGGSLNGLWALSDAEIAGSNPGDPALALAGAVSITLGAWSLLIIYEQEDLPLRRIYYYQGFEEVAGEDRALRPRGFRAPPDPTVDITYLVLEGDDGIQGDSIEVNGQQLQNDCNPRRNVFNSTTNGHLLDGTCERGTQSVDLDAFTVFDALQPGDEDVEVDLIVPRGDGFITPGEQIFTAWMVLAFDHIPANFTSVKPEKSAQPATNQPVAPGQVIDYFILVENNGGDFAENVTVIDAAPAGTTYVPGSASVDMRPVVDLPGDRSPLEAGLNLSALPEIEVIGPGDRHQVRFQVRVDEGLADGTAIQNIAVITADGIEPAESDPVVHFVGMAPDGGLPPPPDMGVQPELDMSPPRADRGVRPPQPDMAPPITDAGCPLGQRRDITGNCVDIQCPEGSMLVGGECLEQDASLCGPGQIFEDGRCAALCGEGLFFDDSCPGGGQCRYMNDPCTPGAGGDGSNDDGCGCAVEGDDARGLWWLLPIGLFGLRRRR